MHIDLAFVLHAICLCCANGVINKFGHIVNDVLLYHTHTCFAWSLVRVGPNGGTVTSTSTAKANHLPPSHVDDVLASRMTLFEGGGDDATQPTAITMSSTPTYVKPPTTSKGGKELHGLQSTKGYAWKRRKKRRREDEAEEDKSVGRPVKPANVGPTTGQPDDIGSQAGLSFGATEGRSGLWAG